jgi:hypothetical protein
MAIDQNKTASCSCSLGRKVQGLHPRRRAGAPWRVAAGRRRIGRRELGSLKPARAPGGHHP